jgi:hypothetical protein
MSTFLKVEGNPSLVRDTRSGAIINTSKSEYETYINLKNNMLERKTQLETNTEQINNIKQDIDEIKQMLQLLIKSKED